MATCPRCGRDADDEFVCAGCGAFLAGDDGEAAAAVSVGRVAVLVLIVCLLGAGGAGLLLSGGGDGHNAAGSDPLLSSPVELSGAPLGAPGETETSRSVAAQPPTSTSASRTRTRTPTPSASTSARRSRSAAPSSTRPSSTRPVSTSATPHPSPSHPTGPSSSTRPPTTPASVPEVHLTEGTLAICGPHCFPLVVRLTNFSAGSHTVRCFSAHDGQFGSYSTTSTTSSNCTYRRPNDTVYVTVDGYRSNAVIW